MKPNDELRRRIEDMKVARAAVTMVMKAGKPEYRVRYSLELPGEPAVERSLVWKTPDVTTEEIEKAVVALAVGRPGRLPRGSRTANWARWRARKVRLRLKQAVEGFSKRAETKDRVGEAERMKRREAARSALVESMKALLRTHPKANRAEVMRAFEEAKRFEVVRSVMEE